MRKILIIDDEPGVVELIKVRLQANGYSAVTAFDGEDGLTKLKAERPDLIILDIQMPKMDGYTFVQEMKKIPDLKTTPVIILTGKEKMQDVFKMEGISDYVLKPFKSEDLLGRVKKYFDNK